MTTFSDGWHLHGGKANNGEKIETHMLDQEAYAKELNKIAKISAILSLAAFVGFLISALD
ncbi:MAG: hypothetical protein ACU0A6_17830 [Shimia sp.]|uniref:hypothetical protein n=1 Tax=Shimia sp. TaxID=1954381 RepID=UPI00405A1D94